ncbi:MAG: type 2 isopentenyl-diphosphate Delta-isomerase [Deltaproteobacteria bacterium]|nr:type 2 isopentenyl-diphosphate Delta-isomerase [Deltaproteobacteria bacterium]
MTDHSQRKAEHLDLAATDRVAFRAKTTLLEEVHLVHTALPELAVEEVDLTVEVVGRRLRAPVVIAAMTGGVERAERVNRDLAAVAQEHGIGFGFGSMRPLLEGGPPLGYRVRDVAPDILLLGNIGIVQARDTGTRQLDEVLGETGCDALCVHLNPAMEVIQTGGDDDFRGGLDTLSRLVEELSVPLIVKETGCGLSRRVGRKLVERGVRWVDTSGAGGTSWVGVETLRAGACTRALGEAFWDWGIPTAASVAQLSGLGLGIIATGGVATGVDIARAIALGATAGGTARPFLQAWTNGGKRAASLRVKQVVDEIRLACLLTGARTPEALQRADLVIGPSLARWIPADSPIRARLPAG